MSMVMMAAVNRATKTSAWSNPPKLCMSSWPVGSLYKAGLLCTLQDLGPYSSKASAILCHSKAQPLKACTFRPDGASAGDAHCKLAPTRRRSAVLCARCWYWIFVFQWQVVALPFSGLRQHRWMYHDSSTFQHIFNAAMMDIQQGRGTASVHESQDPQNPRCCRWYCRAKRWIWYRLLSLTSWW